MVVLAALPVMVGVMAVLGVLAALGSRLPAKAIAPAVAAVCLLAMLVLLAALLAGGQSQLLGGSLSLDGLNAFFLMLPVAAGLALACAGLGQAVPGSLPALVGAAMLVCLAGDARVALLGIALFAAAGSGGSWRPAALAGLFLVGGAFAVLSVDAGLGFVAMRAHPPGDGRLPAVLALTLLGLGLVIGWVPSRRSPSGQDVAGDALPVLRPVIGLYLSVRILLDLCGPATPAWWGLPLLVVGAASAGFGAVTALRSPGMAAVLSGMAVQQGGIMLTGLGVAALARATDVLPLATLALGGAMLHALVHVVMMSLAVTATGAAASGAGSSTLDRLGGLAGPLPIAALGMAVAGASLALLPPSAGFAGLWMLLQALFAAPRLGGLPLQLTVAAVAGVLALAAGFGLAAVIRLGGVVFLGRARSPRAAAATSVTRITGATLAGLSLACAALGAFPGLALRLAEPAQRQVLAAGSSGMSGWLGVQTQLDSPGYRPLAVTVLLAFGLVGLWVTSRRGVLQGVQTVAAWEDGYAAPPAWLPFGDPATQASAAALATIVPDRKGTAPAWPHVRLALHIEWPPMPVRAASMVLLGLAVLLLLAVAA